MLRTSKSILTAMDATDPIESLLKLTANQRAELKRQGITTIRDLLYRFPSRYESGLDVKRIQDTAEGETVTIYGAFSKLETKRSWKTKVPMAEGTFKDDTGTLRIVWFHQPYLAKMLPLNELVRVRGKITVSGGKKSIVNPLAERAGGLPLLESKSGLMPVYPESGVLTSLWFYHAIKRAIEGGVLETVEETLPHELVSAYHLPEIKSALRALHAPSSEKSAEAARKRFAFEEVFFIQLSRALLREKNKKQNALEIDADEKRVAEFVKSFPFSPTDGQKKAIGEILADFLEPHPMSRLLEGDVGSGKTAVAAATAYAVVTSRPKGQSYGNLQVAYMCPTEILAKQHFATFTSFFKAHPIQIGLITSSGCYKYPSKVSPNSATTISRSQLLKWVANGEIPILIGTHALIQKTVSFKHLAYVIIDEQHRFGTAQRYALARGKIAEVTPNGRNTEIKTTNDSLLYRDLTYRIRQALFEVRKNLGFGHKESVYAEAIAAEFVLQKIPFSREVRIPIQYRGKKVGTYIPDFVIDNAVILELKALPFTGAKEKRQLWTCLKGSSYKLGLLVNFSSSDLEISRVVYDKARDPSALSPHESASVPHLLSMTATPIPRTLALTLYGDLDLTILDELPKGRKAILTEIITNANRDRAYEKMRTLLREGRQAYVICPRIDEPDPTKSLALQARSVQSEAKRLSTKVFPEFEIGKLHSKMTPKDKEEVMGRFERGEIHVLVSTSVVEVGVNVPNATMIMIEGAERFGLAQLHQLRGRVMRSEHQPHCFLMVERSTENARLKAIVSAKNGFELAEKDLEIRGAGELYGRRQWGLSDIGMEALKNLKLVEAARKEAFQLAEKDPELSAHPKLKNAATHAASFHLE